MNTDFKKNREDKRKISALLRIQEERRAKEKGEKFGLPYINLVVTPIEINALAQIPEEKTREGNFIPFAIFEKKIGIAVFNPENKIFLETIEELKKKNFKIELFICSKHSLERAWREYKKVPPPFKKIVGAIEISGENIEYLRKEIRNIEALQKKLEEVKKETNLFLETILGSSLAFKASDIHIVPEEKGIRIRYRIDGIMTDIFFFEERLYPSFLSRLKLLSNLRINIHDIPQDGRFSIFVRNKEMDVRVSILPGEYGEDIVMRILNPEMLLSIKDLGFRTHFEKILLSQIKKPTGMILTSGPTGSGKTTTLYACLKYIASPDVKVITIEDPIEYHLEDVDQTQVEEEKGYNFANALRAILRQDPDVILVGEIRDRETVEIAIQAALTGHLVFSTIHANDSTAVIPRLIEIGANPSSIPPALNLVIAQRLIRRICKYCKESFNPSSELISKIEKIFQNTTEEIKSCLSRFQLFKAIGCSKCYHSGYKGRIGIYEMFEMNKKLEEVIGSYPSITEIRKTLSEEGMITLQQDGILRAIEGITTLEEVERITGPLEIPKIS